MQKQYTQLGNERYEQWNQQPGEQHSYGRAAATLGGALLTIYGLTRNSTPGLGLAAAGGAILYRALNGSWSPPGAISDVLPDMKDVAVTKSIAINKSPDEIYTFWRDFTNLPRFMKHLVSVEIVDERRSRWTATGPAGSEVAWDATIVDDQPGSLIAWQSDENAYVANKGTVHFDAAPAGRGTVVRVDLRYTPPAGMFGATVAWLFGEEPSQQIEGDLRRLRSILEAGEIPTTAGQPSGSRSLVGKLMQPEPTKVQNQINTAQ